MQEKLLRDVSKETGAPLTGHHEGTTWVVMCRRTTARLDTEHSTQQTHVTWHKGDPDKAKTWGTCFTPDDLLDVLTDLAWNFEATER